MSNTLSLHDALPISDLVESYLAYYKLPDNVENLYSFVDKSIAIGNLADNIVAGGDGSQVIYGGGGNDILAGGAGSDTFIVRKGEGSDVILDFQAGTGGDKLRLDNYGFADFASVQAAAKQTGANTVLSLGNGETLVLDNVIKTQLVADNFLAPAILNGAHLTFSDDFNSFSMFDAGTGKGTWTTHFEYAGYNDLGSRTLPSNSEKQIYVDSAFKGTSQHSLGLDPFVTKDGVLEIHSDTASPDIVNDIWGYHYTSGLITTKDSFSQEYGYFEIRAQAPSGKGVWPAIWLLPANGTWPPEIDILESIGDAAIAHETSHSNDGGYNSNDSTASPVLPTSDGFHTYGLSWTAAKLIWYIDGAEVKEIATPSDMHQAMYLLINTTVGGNWSGDPDPGTDLHVQFNIDYVHIYGYDNGLASSASPTTTTSSLSTPVNAASPAADSTSGLGSAPIDNPTPVSHPVAASSSAPVPLGFADASAPAITPTTSVVDTRTLDTPDPSGSRIPPASHVWGDFSGSGVSQILVQASDGTVAEWAPGALGKGSLVNIGVMGQEWKLIGVADLDGDGKADLLWRNSADSTVVAFDSSRGVGVASLVSEGTMGAEWQHVGLGDIDGDGRSDVVWWNSRDHSVVAFESSHGTGIGGLVAMGAMGAEWQPVGVGDVDGDGKADVIWRNTADNSVVMVRSVDGAPGTVVGLGSMGPEWKCLTVGDLDGDGRADTVWRNSNDHTVVALESSHGIGAAGLVKIGVVDDGWLALGVGKLAAGSGPALVFESALSGDIGVLSPGGSVEIVGNISSGVAGTWHTLGS